MRIKRNCLYLNLSIIFLAYFLQVSGAETKLIPFTFENKKKIMVEIARTAQERSRGLMFRKELLPDQGMLFVFKQPAYPSFWMKNCLISLDLIWIDPERKIVQIKENVPPCRDKSCPVYKSPQPVLYVLETPAGFVKREGVKVGMKTDFSFDK